MTHRGAPIDLARIRRVALLTIEGENDDISGRGQTEAAHALCSNIPADRKAHWLQPGVGHYGVFNGSRFRSEIAPRIADFVLSNNGDGHGGKRATRNVSLAASKPNGSTPAPASQMTARAHAADVSTANE
jgi:poly(3-hydroxybutyrate) depolymerase